MKNNKKMTLFQANESLTKKFAKKAKIERKSKSRYIREAIEFYMGFNLEVLKKAIRYTALLDLDLPQVCSQLMMARLAYLEAKTEVCGPGTNLWEFTKDEDGNLRTFDQMKEFYKSGFKNERDKNRFSAPVVHHLVHGK